MHIPTILSPLLMKLPSSSIDLSTSDAAGCIAGILRRIRRRNVPKDLEQCVDPVQPRKLPQAAPVPGLVARLMGLDSMPVHPSPMPDTIGRSRSTNSIETWRGFLAHKRTISDPSDRPTQSFRELPTYLTLTQESDEFLLLSFAHGGGKKKEANPNSNTGDSKTETARKSRKEKKPERKSHRNQMQAVVKERHENARKKLAHSSTEIESECSCQDLSPVSVLEQDTDGDCSPSPESRITVRRVQEDMKPRQRKLLSDFADRKDASLRIQNRKTPSVKKKSTQVESYRCDFAEVWALICRMADENLKGLNWVWREDVEEIAAEIGMEILDYLISEAVFEL